MAVHNNQKDATKKGTSHWGGLFFSDHRKLCVFTIKRNCLLVAASLRWGTRRRRLTAGSKNHLRNEENHERAPASAVYPCGLSDSHLRWSAPRTKTPTRTIRTTQGSSSTSPLTRAQTWGLRSSNTPVKAFMPRSQPVNFSCGSVRNVFTRRTPHQVGHHPHLRHWSTARCLPPKAYPHPGRPSPRCLSDLKHGRPNHTNGHRRPSETSTKTKANASATPTQPRPDSTAGYAALARQVAAPALRVHRQSSATTVFPALELPRPQFNSANLRQRRRSRPTINPPVPASRSYSTARTPAALRVDNAFHPRATSPEEIKLDPSFPRIGKTASPQPSNRLAHRQLRPPMTNQWLPHGQPFA